MDRHGGNGAPTTEPVVFMEELHVMDNKYSLVGVVRHLDMSDNDPATG